MSPGVDKELQGDEQAARGVRLYVFVCMVSATVIALVLIARDLETAALLPAVVGFVMPLLRPRSGAIWLLLSLVWVGLADQVGLDPFGLGVRVLAAVLTLIARTPFIGMRRHPFPHLATPQPVLDALLCVAVVAYVASYYRLLSLTRHIFPIDRRRRVVKKDKKATLLPPPAEEQKRSGRLVDAPEVGRLAVGVCAAVMLAHLLTAWLRDRHPGSDLWRLTPIGVQVQLPAPLWQLLVLLWLFGFMLIVAQAVIGYLGMRRSSPEEAALYLQDQLWRQTRREQARLNRWLAWAEKREARRRARQETHS
jgi:hypothetical protein